FVMKGNRSAVPLVVNINVYQKPVIEVLRDLGLQLGRRADVTVNGERGLIELRYAAVDRT
ncbi:MAG: DotD/TraH family lipoprotein, partial [Bdellovibrionales bacterium]